MIITDENPQYEADNIILTAVLKRQLDVSLATTQIARALYDARTLWIGGGLRWHDLTPLQKHGYRQEVETLIKGAK